MEDSVVNTRVTVQTTATETLPEASTQPRSKHGHDATMLHVGDFGQRETSPLSANALSINVSGVDFRDAQLWRGGSGLVYLPNQPLHLALSCLR